MQGGVRLPGDLRKIVPKHCILLKRRSHMRVNNSSVRHPVWKHYSKFTEVKYKMNTEKDDRGHKEAMCKTVPPSKTCCPF